MEVITSHLNADFDALASMIAAKKLYPQAIIAFSGSQEKNLRDFFLQSLQYLYDFEKLRKIPLKEIRRLIVVDTHQAERIGSFSQCLTNPGIEIHIYDHHPNSADDIHGQHEVIKKVGATATIFTQIFREQNIPITPEEATLLALGIYEDTGSFTFASTTPDDLEAAAFLLSKGANVYTISHFISHELTTHQISLLHELIKSAQTYTIQGIDIVIAKTVVSEYVDDFSLLVRRFMEMENLNVLFALSHMGDRVYLIARSRVPEVNVGEIAAEFGGGGHASAASATIRNFTLVETEEKLVGLLHNQVRPRNTAAELMSAPVISVEPEVEINEANQILTRYNITVLPVMKGHRELQGLISRRVIEKAIFHKLGHLPVSEYMTTECITLPSSATLTEIEEVIIESRQRFLPVVDGTEVKGVITRTDLLNLLVNDPAHLPKDMLALDEMPGGERYKNINSLLIECLDKKIITLLRTIGEVAAENHDRSFAVGGFVRDLLLHKKNPDLDIVIEGDGIAFAKQLAKHFGVSVRTHEKFGTAIVIMPDGFHIDVATARLEYYEYPAAMPTVELSSLKLDLYRRDFTLNALAIHLNPDKFGMLVDFFHSQKDIKDRQIRVLHNLSFVEDPTRVFRAIRFEHRMGFRISKHTEKLIKNAVKMNFFHRFSGRRFFEELRLILSEEDPIPALLRMAEFDLAKYIHPDLRIDARTQKILSEAQRVLSWHRLLYLEKPCQAWMLYLLVLFGYIPLKGLRLFCKRFEVPPRFQNALIREKALAEKILRTLYRRALLRSSEIYWLFQGMSTEGILCVMAISKSEKAQKAASLYVTNLRNTKTLITGIDLKDMGYTPGPLYKTILSHLLEAKLDGDVRTREEEINFIKLHYPFPHGISPQQKSQP